MATRMQLADDTTFRVINWDTNAVIQTFDTANAAKRFCKAQGFLETRLGGKMPVAYVQADYISSDGTKYTDCCFYNPRF